MRKRWVWVFLLVFCFSFLGSCANRQAPLVGRAVTKVEVTCRRPGQTLKRIYTREDKMRAVLIYLRLLEPKGFAPWDPETTRTDSSLITVSFCDGSRHIYEQAGSEYLRKDQQPWQRIRNISPQRLYLLIHAIPEDES